jgi:peptidoglycan hydrolase CwlO-like protein
MSSSPSPSPSNEIQVILAKLANLRERQKRIESEIQRFGLINITDEAIYRKVQKLQDRMNKIKNTLEAFKNDAKCNKQCENIHITKDSNSVDEFLLDLILKSAEPLEPSSLTPSAPPEE